MAVVLVQFFLKQLSTFALPYLYTSWVLHFPFSLYFFPFALETEFQCCHSLQACRCQPASESRMDLDVVNMLVIAGGTLAVPILAFVALFLLWPSALIKIYYW